MRWIPLLLVALVAGCPAPSDDDLEATCASPPWVAEADDIVVDASAVRLRVRVDSDEWSPHALWLDVFDEAVGEDVLPAPGEQRQPGTDGVVEWVPMVQDGPDERRWLLTVTDPAGCQGSGELRITWP